MKYTPNSIKDHIFFKIHQGTFEVIKKKKNSVSLNWLKKRRLEEVKYTSISIQDHVFFKVHHGMR